MKMDVIVVPDVQTTFRNRMTVRFQLFIVFCSSIFLLCFYFLFWDIFFLFIFPFDHVFFGKHRWDSDGRVGAAVRHGIWLHPNFGKSSRARTSTDVRLVALDTDTNTEHDFLECQPVFSKSSIWILDKRQEQKFSSIPLREIDMNMFLIIWWYFGSIWYREIVWKWFRNVFRIWDSFVSRRKRSYAMNFFISKNLTYINIYRVFQKILNIRRKRQIFRYLCGFVRHQKMSIFDFQRHFVKSWFWRQYIDWKKSTKEMCIKAVTKSKFWNQNNNY